MWVCIGAASTTHGDTMLSRLAEITRRARAQLHGDSLGHRSASGSPGHEGVHFPVTTPAATTIAVPPSAPVLPSARHIPQGEALVHRSASVSQHVSHELEYFLHCVEGASERLKRVKTQYDKMRGRAVEELRQELTEMWQRPPSTGRDLAGVMRCHKLPEQH